MRNVKNENTEILRSEIKKEIVRYKNQDVLKKFNKDKFINVEEVVKKLLNVRMYAYIVKKNAKMFYRYVRDIQQWSLDRIDNNYGHNRDNVEIACLKCTKKKTIAPDKYIQTQEITKNKKYNNIYMLRSKRLFSNLKPIIKFSRNMSDMYQFYKDNIFKLIESNLVQNQ